MGVKVHLWYIQENLDFLVISISRTLTDKQADSSQLLTPFDIWGFIYPLNTLENAWVSIGHVQIH